MSPTRIILHVDFNSYFATVEQQANPRLRGKPIGVTGGDRLERTVVGAASVEAKKLGIRTGMSIGEARKIYPDLILVKGDSEKYLECTKRFLNILRNYSPFLEVFSIDEVFLQLPQKATFAEAFQIGQDIKDQISKKVGDWITCSIGISYNKRMAKMAGSLYKPNGLVVIEDEEAAQFLLDRIALDDICGIGFRIKKRLYEMGITNFGKLREVPLENLLASFKSYGQVLYDMARGKDDTAIVPFYDKEEVKSVGHRHTLNHDTTDSAELKQLFLKLTELIARKLRSKKLVGKTVSVWYRAAFNLEFYQTTGSKFYGDGMQLTISNTNDGLAIFQAAWKGFFELWRGESLRMVGVSVSNLKPSTPINLGLFPESYRTEKILTALDSINDKYGEFTLQRGILLGSVPVSRKPNSFLADRRFKI